MREDDRPDREAERNEWCDKARLIVMHVLPAKDRKVLTLFYWRHKPVWKIAEQLGVSEAAVLQRLVRAERRLRREGSTSNGPLLHFGRPRGVAKCCAKRSGWFRPNGRRVLQVHGGRGGQRPIPGLPRTG